MYLSVLRDMRLVEREIPVTDPNPLRSRRGVYRIADRFVAFHFRHVQPHRSLIQAGRGERVLEESVQPDLPRLLDDARVDFVLDHLRREAAEVLGAEVTEVGRHSGTWVRAVGRTADGGSVAAIVVPDGAARTSTAPLERELANLREVFGTWPEKLVYGLAESREQPLRVERVPEGAVL